MNRLVDLLFERRGLTPEDLREINVADYDDLTNIDKICAELAIIRDTQEHIVIIPDFDMDGIMSATVGIAGMTELGFNVDLYYPNPSSGYGFDSTDIEKIVTKWPDTKAIITCDVGISCVDGIRAALLRGIKPLITDHHVEQEDTSPRDMALAMVDPMALDSEYSHPGICGAFVLWQVLRKFAEVYGTAFQVDQIERLRVFAGIGTISDVMPVLYENRQLIRDSYAICRLVWNGGDASFVENLPGTDTYKNAFAGLFSVIALFFYEKKLTYMEDIDEQFFGFYMAPMFNSAKRMNGDMSRVYSIFTSGSPDADVRYLFDLNEQRKDLVAETYERMTNSVNAMAPYVYVVDALPGILGLLAMKFMSANEVPCLVLTPDGHGGYSGSGRSPEWYPFITNTLDINMMRAGHEGAFGCGFENFKQLSDYYEFMATTIPTIKADLADDDVESDVDLTIATDGSGDTIVDITLFTEFLEEIDRYKPFGNAFPRPRFKLIFDADEAEWRRIGSEKTHLRLILPYGLVALAWNQAHIMADGVPEGRITMIGELQFNEFMGNISVQFVGGVLEDD